MKYIIILVFISLIVSCSKPEPRKPIVRKTGSFLSESVKRNKEINKFQENLLEAIRVKDSLNNYINSNNGFWYYYTIKDSLKGKTPVKGDIVLFTYSVRNLQDTILFSNKDIGNIQYAVGKQEMISGIHDGIKLMKEGETATFLFPSYKAYGYLGNERVNPNEPVIITIELKKIN